MKLEIEVFLPSGESVHFTLEEAKQLFNTLKNLFEPVA